MWKNRRIYQLLYHIFFKNWITNGKFLYWYVCYRMDLVSLPSLRPSPLWEAHPLSLHLVQLVDDRPIEFEPHCLRYLEGSRTKHGKNKVSQCKLVSSRFFGLTKLVLYTIPSRKQDLWRCTCNSLSVCNLLFHLLNFISSLAMTCTKFFNVDLEFNAMDNAMFYIWYYQNVKKIYIDEMIWEDNLE